MAATRTPRRHGLTGAFALLPDENAGQFKAHYDAYLTHHRPKNRAERALVQTMAEVQWRLRRAGHAEQSAFIAFRLQGMRKTAIALDVENTRVLANVSLYEQRLLKLFRQTENQLTELQWERKQKDRERHRKAVSTEAAHQNKGTSEKFANGETPHEARRDGGGANYFFAVGGLNLGRSGLPSPMPRVPSSSS